MFSSYIFYMPIYMYKHTYLFKMLPRMSTLALITAALNRTVIILTFGNFAENS